MSRSRTTAFVVPFLIVLAACGSPTNKTANIGLTRAEVTTSTSTSTSTTTTVPPTTTTTAPRGTVPPRPPVTRVARIRVTVATPATTPVVAAPAEGDLTFPPECLSHGYWASFRQTEQKIGPAHRCWDALLAKYPWDVHYAFSTMMCESEADPNEVNSSGATGLMQVITRGASTEPNQNMRQAWAKYTGAGNSWNPWKPSRSCASTHSKG